MFVKTTVFVTQHLTSIRETKSESASEREGKSERCEKGKEEERVRMLYVAFVSLKRAMYDKSEGEMNVRVNSYASERRPERKNER